MPGDEYAADPLVTFDGSPLPADVGGTVLAVSVDARRGAPAVFVVRFADERGAVLSKAGVKVGSAARVSVQLSGPGGPVPLVTGTVTTVETELGPSGRVTTVRGMDDAYRLVGARRYASFVNMTASDIARKVATSAGFRARVEATSPVLPYVVQPNVTDWELLQRLAVESGTSLRVDDGTLVFGAPPESSGGPSGSASARTDALVLEEGVNVLRLRATVTAASQVTGVEARGWNPTTKQAVVGTASAATRSATLPGATPGALGKQAGAPALVVSSTAHVEQAQVDAFARSVADRVAGSFAELEATVRGNPGLVVGAAVALAGFGEPFDGRYTVSAARHDLSGETGYTTTVTVSDAADRSLYGLTRGPGPGGARATGPDVVPAIVTDVNDPDKLGRVRVKLPTAGDDVQTWWARVVQAGAGSTRGLVLQPEVGDEVLVVLTERGAGQPYVLGGLFNGKDLPRGGWAEQVVSGEVVRRSLTSRTGMFLEFTEANGQENVVLSSADGKQRLSIVTKPDAAVQVVSSGPIELTADQDVKVKGANVTLEGTKLTLKGTSEIVLEAPTVKADATAELKLHGTQAEVKGDAMLEVSASGPTVVKGAVVNIN